MIYIYNCFGGTHSSSLAAAVHLKQINPEKPLSNEDIFSIDYFDRLGKEDMGKFIYRGTDEDGNKVYTFGRGSSDVLIPAIGNFVNLLSIECGLKAKIIISNLSPTVNFFMTVGGTISRFMKLPFLGRPFLAAGAKKAVINIKNVVEMTRRTAENMSGTVIVLDNK
ncbi:MAG: DUF3189 family protein [Eubacteriales bacterium]|nr:DUF3189 family protein [Eubacteriales bacterium]